MRFTVTMECGECKQKFVGQGEHLVDAVGTMVKSAYERDHAHDRMNQELAALAQKAEEVNVVDGLLSSLGMLIVDLSEREEEPDAEA